MSRADTEQIELALRVLAADGAVRELRVPKTRRGTLSGYFDSSARFAAEAARVANLGAGTYLTLNPVNPDLLARAANRVVEYARHTTADSDILSRTWLLVDADPTRPSGISSTDAEHEGALAVAHRLQDWLIELGFSAGSIVLADSGNGGHVLIRIDLPNDAASHSLVERCLRTLDLYFTDSVVKIDTSVGNAARICKLYGTVAAKGDDLPDRPHRVSRLLVVPEAIEVAPRSLLERLADLGPGEARDSTGWPLRNSKALDLEGWIAERGLVIARTAPWQGGRKFVLDTCVWNPDHQDGSAFIVQFASGAIAAGCHHNSCEGRDWHALREMFDPAADRVLVTGQQHYDDRPPAKQEATATRRLRLEPASAIRMRPTRWLWDTSGDAHHPADREGRLPEGALTIAVGRAGIGKSQFGAWLTAQITRGTLPGTCYGTPRAVIVCASEDSWEMTIAPRLAAAGADLDRVFRVAVVEGEGGLVLPLDTEGLRGLITEVSAAAVIFDPLLSLLDAGVDDYRAKEVRAALEPTVAVLNDTRATGLGVAHFTKASGNDPLMLISGSGAFGQLIRAAIGFARDEESGAFVMSTIKSNLGREDLPSLAYSIEGVPIATPEGEAWTSRLVFTGESPRTVRDLLREAARAPVEMTAAREIDIWLRDYLESAGGAVAARDVYTAGAPAGYSPSAISKARMRIGAISTREGFGREASYLWSLPDATPPMDSHGFPRADAGIHGIHAESMDEAFDAEAARAEKLVRL